MEVGSVVTAIRGALEVARVAKDVNDQAQLNAAMSEVMEKLTTAQSDLLSLLVQQQDLVEENRRLKEALEKEARFDRYRLCKTPLRHFVYMLKEEHVTEDKPGHAICVKCREVGRLSILQDDEYRYYCQSCGGVADIKEFSGIAMSDGPTYLEQW